LLLKGLQNKPIEIDEGESPSLSSDQTKIAYVKMDIDNNIHIYDIISGEKETITTDEWRLRRISWSPNGKYY
jgi:Tol biopolymer transport system component